MGTENKIMKIGVIGAGNIGSSLAHNLMISNKQVVLVDQNQEVLARSKKEILSTLHFTAMYLKKKIKFSKTLIDNIEFTSSLNKVAECDFIVENVTEDWQIKKDVYRELDDICNPKVIFGANTSCISITKIGAATNRADKVIGMHFMNPVYLKNVVEVIKGFHTSQETVLTVNSFLADLDKTSIIVNDFPGFVSNRISHLFMNEAIYTLQDQVADAKAVDTIFKTCFGHKMGPLETADLIGLDTVLNSLVVLHQSYCDSKYRPCPLLQKMVDAGMLGVKSKKGFYTYV